MCFWREPSQIPKYLQPSARHWPAIRCTVSLSHSAVAETIFLPLLNPKTKMKAWLEENWLWGAAHIVSTTWSKCVHRQDSIVLFGFIQGTMVSPFWFVSLSNYCKVPPLLLCSENVWRGATNTESWQSHGRIGNSWKPISTWSSRTSDWAHKRASPCRNTHKERKHIAR